MFLRKCMILISVLAPLVVATLQLALGDEVGSPRSVQQLGEGWKFAFGKFEGAEAPGFDDSVWENVSVPHTWNSKDGADGGNNYARGTGWYRLRFKPSIEIQNRRCYLRFDGVSILSTVWLNGKELGRHTSGFSAACYDATEWLKPGENLLVVCADNSPYPDLPPAQGDFTYFGGVYRTVLLITAPLVSIDLLDRASPGVYLVTPSITDAEGTVRARVRIRNSGPAAQNATATVTILDACGNQVGLAAATVPVVSGAVAEPTIDLAVPNPHLWQGRADPYLYQAVVIVRAGESRDEVRQPLGFRTVRVDPNIGCFLNGKPYDLHGVSIHQDREGKGWATSAADREEDVRLAYDMGCTFVRIAHYQQDQSVYDACDRMGLLVWAENCWVDSTSFTDDFYKQKISQLTDLIRQCCNHPSIITWSLGNEVIVPRRKNVNLPDDGTTELIQLLHDTARNEDPSRPTAMAKRHKQNPTVTDLTALNCYFGWYYGEPSQLGPHLDERRAANPGVCIGIGEYGAGAGFKHPTVPAKRGHSEQWQSLVHEESWLQLKARPWVWCKAVWVLADFAADKRNEGDSPGINDKGLVSRDRKIKKDAYFWYQANWTEKLMVHLNSRRFNPRTDAATEVRLCSNAEKVELFLNGQSLGMQDVKECRAVWPQVTLRPGANVIKAVARRNGETAEDGMELTLAPTAKGEKPAPVMKEKIEDHVEGVK